MFFLTDLTVYNSKALLSGTTSSFNLCYCNTVRPTGSDSTLFGLLAYIMQDEAGRKVSTGVA